MGGWLAVRSLGAGVLLGASLLVAGCTEPAFPRDAEGSLERVIAERTLRVGAAENPPWIEVAGDDVTGVEAEILAAWAESMGATLVWTPGSESQLILSLDEGGLDVVTGGIRADSPWTAHAALTRPHAESVGPDGKTEKLVFAVRLGENALLSSLERFLIEEGMEP